MIIYGVAVLAACTVIGAYLGDLLGALIGVKANVGGVGIAMLLLVIVRFWMMRTGRLTLTFTAGIEFWSLMYIPIVVAMAAQQNVVAAVKGGPVVLTAGVLTVALSFLIIPLLAGRSSKPSPAEPGPGTLDSGNSGQ